MRRLSICLKITDRYKKLIVFHNCNIKSIDQVADSKADSYNIHIKC